MKRILSRRSKAERREERAGIGKIGDNLVLPSTLLRYGASFDAFRSFIQRLAIRRTSTIPEYIDFALVAYLEHLWQEGEGVAVGNYTLAGLLHFVPSLRGELHCARRILKRMAPPRTARAGCPSHDGHAASYVWSLRLVGPPVCSLQSADRLRPVLADQ